MIELYPCGTQVKLTRSSNEGVIVAIQIEGQVLIKYLVAYYLNGEYKSVWLFDYEFSSEEKQRVSVGFK